MDLLTLVTFAVTYAIVCAVPGPGVAAIVARGLGGGFRGAVPMVVGILVGDLIYLSFAAFGLAAIAAHFGPVFTIIRYASAIYLLYIAWRFWTARPGSEQIGPKREGHWSKTVLAGLSLTLGNPKTIVFYLALLPSLIDLQTVTLLGWLELSLVTLSVLAVVFGSYVLLAARTRALFTSPRAIRMVNRGTGAMMASAAVAMAAK